MKNSFSTRKHFYKVLSCFCYFLLNIKAGFSQTNLVPNPSFEQYITCPDNTTFENRRFNKPEIWYKPDVRAAGYHNRCSNNISNYGVPYNKIGGGVSYQESKTGDAYLVMFYYNQDGNNYIQVKLYDNLKVGKKYYGEYYVSLANTYIKGCNNISMLFTNQAIYADTTNYPSFLPANPQILSYGNPIVTDTMGWVKISGIFTAQGGEQYLTLGNFKLASQTQFTQIAPFGTGYNGSAYYVDDVSVIPLDSFNLKADAGKDTTINIGDSVFIGSLTNGIDSLQWLQNGILKIDSLRPGFWVHPLVSNCYVLTQTVNGFTSSDTVCVNVLPLPLNFINYSLRQAQGDNPSSLRGTKQSVENIWVTANEINVSHFNIQRSLNGRDYVNVGSIKAQNKSSNEYSFIDNELPITNDPLTIYYRLQSIDKDGRKQYSEVRNIEYRTRNNELRIYPNPAKEFVTVECKGAKELLIVDYLGRVVYKQILRQAQNDNKPSTIINVQGWLKGLYLLKVITTNGTTAISKFVKE